MSSPALSPLLVALVACALTLALTPALRAAARRVGLLDRPNPRSSHQTAVPRGGGIAIALATLGALGLLGAGLGSRATPVLLGAVALAAVGLLDDRFSLSAGVRVGAQLFVAIAVVLALGGLERMPLPPPLDWALGALGAPLAALWIVTVVNFFNFLDGIDGLATLQAVVTGSGIAIAAWDPSLALVAGALAGAALGFLPFNWARASVFLGDVGSYFLGFTLAALPLGAVPEWRSGAVLFVAISLWLFLADATWTLARRGLRGAPVHEAHREHLYQRLALRFGHARVTLSIGIASATLTGFALVALASGSAALAWAALGLAVAFFAAEAAAASAAGAAARSAA
jgi:Fuc2NAc and GlcNAc transferase